MFLQNSSSIQQQQTEIHKIIMEELNSNKFINRLANLSKNHKLIIDKHNVHDLEDSKLYKINQSYLNSKVQVQAPSDVKIGNNKKKMYGAKKSIIPYATQINGKFKQYTQAQQSAIKKIQAQNSKLINLNIQKRKKKLIGATKKIQASSSLIDHSNLDNNLSNFINQNKIKQIPKNNLQLTKQRKVTALKPKLIGRQRKITAQIDYINSFGEQYNQKGLADLKQNKNRLYSKQPYNSGEELNILNLEQVQQKFLDQLQSPRMLKMKRTNSLSQVISNNNKIQNNEMKNQKLSNHQQNQIGDEVFKKILNSKAEDKKFYLKAQKNNYNIYNKVPSVIITPCKKVRAYYCNIHEGQKNPKIRYGQFFQKQTEQKNQAGQKSFQNVFMQIPTKKLLNEFNNKQQVCSSFQVGIEFQDKNRIDNQPNKTQNQHNEQKIKNNQQIKQCQKQPQVIQIFVSSSANKEQNNIQQKLIQQQDHIKQNTQKTQSVKQLQQNQNNITQECQNKTRFSNFVNQSRSHISQQSQYFQTNQQYKFKKQSKVNVTKTNKQINKFDRIEFLNQGMSNFTGQKTHKQDFISENQTIKGSVRYQFITSGSREQQPKSFQLRNKVNSYKQICRQFNSKSCINEAESCRIYNKTVNTISQKKISKNIQKRRLQLNHTSKSIQANLQQIKTQKLVQNQINPIQKASKNIQLIPILQFNSNVNQNQKLQQQINLKLGQNNKSLSSIQQVSQLQQKQLVKGQEYNKLDQPTQTGMVDKNGCIQEKEIEQYSNIFDGIQQDQIITNQQSISDQIFSQLYKQVLQLAIQNICSGLESLEVISSIPMQKQIDNNQNKTEQNIQNPFEIDNELQKLQQKSQQDHHDVSQSNITQNRLTQQSIQQIEQKDNESFQEQNPIQKQMIKQWSNNQIYCQQFIENLLKKQPSDEKKDQQQQNPNLPGSFGKMCSIQSSDFKLNNDFKIAALTQNDNIISNNNQSRSSISTIQFKQIIHIKQQINQAVQHIQNHIQNNNSSNNNSQQIQKNNNIQEINILDNNQKEAKLAIKINSKNNLVQQVQQNQSTKISETNKNQNIIKKMAYFKYKQQQHFRYKKNQNNSESLSKTLISFQQDNNINLPSKRQMKKSSSQHVGMAVNKINFNSKHINIVSTFKNSQHYHNLQLNQRKEIKKFKSEHIQPQVRKQNVYKIVNPNWLEKLNKSNIKQTKIQKPQCIVKKRITLKQRDSKQNIDINKTQFQQFQTKIPKLAKNQSDNFSNSCMKARVMQQNFQKLHKKAKQLDLKIKRPGKSLVRKIQVEQFINESRQQQFE